jgi:hypothetical protein
MNGSDYIYREYPKMLTTSRGLVIVHSIAEEGTHGNPVRRARYCGSIKTG